MTVYILSNLYNEKFHLYYYDENNHPDDVIFIPFNNDLPSDAIKIM